MAVVSNGTTIIDAGALGSGVATGKMTLIKTLTASSSATLSFVDGAASVVLDNTYDSYVFKFISIHPGTNATHLSFQASTDTGSNYGVAATTTLFRSFHDEADSATGVVYRAEFDLAQSTGFIPLADGTSTGADNDQTVSGYIQLFNPSSTTFVKHFISNFNEAHQVDYSIHGFAAGYFNTTSAVDAIQFKMNSGNIDAGLIKLYGIGG